MKLLSMFAVAGSAGAEPISLPDVRPADAPLPLADADPTDAPFPIDVAPVPDVPPVIDAEPKMVDAPAAAQTDDGCGVAGGGADALVLVLGALAGARRRRRPSA